MLRAKLGGLGRHCVKTKVNHDVRARNCRLQVIPLIRLSADLQIRTCGRSGQQCLAHSAFVTDDREFDHAPSRFVAMASLRTPQSFKVALSVSRFFELIGTNGSRYSSWMRPIMAKAAFTGIGLVSMNR